MERWQASITKPKLAGFLGGAALLVLALLLAEPGFVPILDHANLLFHEAGHPIVGLFSTRLEPYGGTMGQLAFPVVLAISFWRKRELVGLGFSALWFFENWFNITRYMADARRLQLPLVGGGDHDWNTILDRWNILQYDTRIAGVLVTVAWICIVVTVSCILLTGLFALRRSDRPQLHSPSFEYRH